MSSAYKEFANSVLVEFYGLIRKFYCFRSILFALYSLVNLVATVIALCLACTIRFSY